MARRSGVGLKALQSLLRSILFLASLVVLALYAYFLAKLHSKDLYIANWVRAVEGISGACALYVLVGLPLLWCAGGHSMPMVIFVVLDILFIGGYMYIAYENRGGRGSCNGNDIRTPFGYGSALVDRAVNRNGQTVSIPRFRTSCRLEKACLAVSVIAIILLLLTIGTEFLLARHRRREKKFGPGPSNGYTSGSGCGNRRGAGLMGLLRRKKNTSHTAGYDEKGANGGDTLPAGVAYDPQYASAAPAPPSNVYQPASANAGAYATTGAGPYATTSSGVIAEGPASATVRGTGVDNYDAIRAGAHADPYQRY